MKNAMLLCLILYNLSISGCAGAGFNKKATLMPDSIGLETDLDPLKHMNFKLVEVRAIWNLK